MKRILSNHSGLWIYAAAAALFFAFALPATAGEESSEKAANTGVTTAEEIRTAADSIHKKVHEIGHAGYVLDFGTRDKPQLGVVNGKDVNEALADIRALTGQCKRQHAANVAAGKESPCVKCMASMDKIRDIVFDMRTNAAWIVSPSAPSPYAYLVNVDRFQNVADELSRLAANCRAGQAVENVGSDDEAAAPKRPAVEVAHAKSLVW
jgi:hypothetical protein